MAARAAPAAGGRRRRYAQNGVASRVRAWASPPRSPKVKPSLGGCSLRLNTLWRPPTFLSQMADNPTTLPDFSQPPFAGAPEARFEPLPADGVLPEGFFSTSNLPTYILVESRWLAPVRPRMDCVVVKRPTGLETIEPRRLRRGDLIAMGEAEDGSQGIVVHSQGFLGSVHGANEFRFMSTEVSRERPVNYDELAARVGEEKRSGGYLVWVVGPALVHSRARAGL